MKTCCLLFAAALVCVYAQPQRPPASNGINVGDTVEVVTAQGWTQARVVAINGNQYKVHIGAYDVTKTYPGEVRRQGALTAQDHAAGQYRAGERVQVMFEGRWVESKILIEMGREYQVEIPGGRTAWTTGQNLRPSNAPPPPGPVKAGTPPKAGLVSCGSKFDGRWSLGSGFGNFTIRFKAGKATISYIGPDEEVECWMGGGRIILHKPGDDANDMPIEINDDGTLSTPMGDIRRKGN